MNGGENPRRDVVYIRGSGGMESSRGLLTTSGGIQR